MRPSILRTELSAFQPSRNALPYILLKVSVEELVVIDMVDTVFKEYTGILFFRNVGELERAAPGVDAGSRQRGDLAFDGPGVISETRALVEPFVAQGAVRLPG